MLDVLLWISAGLWALFLVQLIANRLLIPSLPEARPPKGKLPLVSIVSPARNEERGIRAAVSSFCRQDYPRLEVIVVDDRSTDATPRILEELKGEFPNLRVIRGEDPPEGWLGKPNALETGRKAAKGDWILFVDADVVYKPDVVSRSVDFVTRDGAAMLCLWPDIATGELLEAVVLSRIAMAFTILPAFLANRSKSKLIAVGGGVFNMVRRDALEACGAFECLKHAVIDDIGLGYKVKAAGFRQAAALAGDLLRIRMYHGFRETLDGLNKNIYPALREFPLLLLFIPFMGVLIHFLPYAGLAWGAAQGELSVPALAGLAFMHLAVGGTALTFRMPWALAFLNPVGEAIWWWIIVRSYRVYRRSGIVWRGRSYGRPG